MAITPISSLDTATSVGENDYLVVSTSNGVKKIEVSKVGGGGGGGGFAPDLTFNNVRIHIDSSESGDVLSSEPYVGTITLNTSIEDLRTKITNNNFTVADGVLCIEDGAKDGTNYSKVYDGILNTGFYYGDTNLAISESSFEIDRIAFIWGSSSFTPSLLQMFNLQSLDNCVFLIITKPDNAPLIIYLDCTDPDDVTIVKVIKAQ